MHALEAGSVRAWVQEVLLDPERKKPIVAITTLPRVGTTWVDPERMERALEDSADVVLIETGDATWELADSLPPRLDAYGGAIRIWWPGLTVDSDPYEHELFFVHSPEESDPVLQRIVGAIRGGDEPVAAERIFDDLRVGEVVEGRVQNLKEYGAFVELLPGVAGLVHKSEIDWDFVRDVRDFVQQGEVVPVMVKSLDRENGRIELSIKRARGAPVRPLPALEPGGAPFRWPASAPRPAEARTPAPPQRADESALKDELDAANQDRARLREMNQDLKRQLRSLQDRFDDQQRRLQPELDPLSSETAFLLGVRLAYGRLFNETDRQEHPLLPMRVGTSFLATLRDVGGIEVDKVLEVCAQVASDTAHLHPSREVHQLRVGPRGSPSRTRAGDDAQAWRCSLQVNTPSARRLHWWRVPSPTGAAIEFASVGLHDEFSIPE